MQNTTYNGTSPNWSAAIKQVVLGYSDAVGPVALVLIFLLPFSMAFIANRNMKGVAILGILISTFVFIYLPSNFVAAAVICIGISAAALIWSLFKQV
jgi:asparagine N-glycosylation enzyme membrane subunit Stt3